MSDANFEAQVADLYEILKGNDDTTPIKDEVRKASSINDIVFVDFLDNVLPGISLGSPLASVIFSLVTNSEHVGLDAFVNAMKSTALPNTHGSEVDVTPTSVGTELCQLSGALGTEEEIKKDLIKKLKSFREYVGIYKGYVVAASKPETRTDHVKKHLYCAKDDGVCKTPLVKYFPGQCDADVNVNNIDRDTMERLLKELSNVSINKSSTAHVYRVFQAVAHNLLVTEENGWAYKKFQKMVYDTETGKGLATKVENSLTDSLIDKVAAYVASRQEAEDRLGGMFKSVWKVGAALGILAVGAMAVRSTMSPKPTPFPLPPLHPTCPWEKTSTKVAGPSVAPPQDIAQTLPPVPHMEPSPFPLPARNPMSPKKLPLRFSEGCAAGAADMSMNDGPSCNRGSRTVSNLQSVNFGNQAEVDQVRNEVGNLRGGYDESDIHKADLLIQAGAGLLVGADAISAFEDYYKTVQIGEIPRNSAARRLSDLYLAQDVDDIINNYTVKYTGYYGEVAKYRERVEVAKSMPEGSIEDLTQKMSAMLQEKTALNEITSKYSAAETVKDPELDDKITRVTDKLSASIQAKKTLEKELEVLENADASLISKESETKFDHLDNGVKDVSNLVKQYKATVRNAVNGRYKSVLKEVDDVKRELESIEGQSGMTLQDLEHQLVELSTLKSKWDGIEVKYPDAEGMSDPGINAAIYRKQTTMKDAKMALKDIDAVTEQLKEDVTGPIIKNGSFFVPAMPDSVKAHDKNQVRDVVDGYQQYKDILNSAKDTQMKKIQQREGELFETSAQFLADGQSSTETLQQISEFKSAAQKTGFSDVVAHMSELEMQYGLNAEVRSAMEIGLTNIKGDTDISALSGAITHWAVARGMTGSSAFSDIRTAVIDEWSKRIVAKSGSVFVGAVSDQVHKLGELVQEISDLLSDVMNAKTGADKTAEAFGVSEKLNAAVSARVKTHSVLAQNRENILAAARQKLTSTVQESLRAGQTLPTSDEVGALAALAFFESTPENVLMYKTAMGHRMIHRQSNAELMKSMPASRMMREYLTATDGTLKRMHDFDTGSLKDAKGICDGIIEPKMSGYKRLYQNRLADRFQAFSSIKTSEVAQMGYGAHTREVLSSVMTGPALSGMFIAAMEDRATPDGTLSIVESGLLSKKMTAAEAETFMRQATNGHRMADNASLKKMTAEQLQVENALRDMAGIVGCRDQPHNAKSIFMPLMTARGKKILEMLNGNTHDKRTRVETEDDDEAHDDGAETASTADPDSDVGTSKRTKRRDLVTATEAIAQGEQTEDVLAEVESQLTTMSPVEAVKLVEEAAKVHDDKSATKKLTEPESRAVLTVLRYIPDKKIRIMALGVLVSACAAGIAAHNLQYCTDLATDNSFVRSMLEMKGPFYTEMCDRGTGAIVALAGAGSAFVSTVSAALLESRLSWLKERDDLFLNFLRWKRVKFCEFVESADIGEVDALLKNFDNNELLTVRHFQNLIGDTKTKEEVLLSITTYEKHIQEAKPDLWKKIVERFP